MPKNRAAKIPVILTLSPYLPAERNYDEAVYFARSGFAYMALDSRGRGDSQGKFVPFENDARDGFDAVEWLARQPWSDGNVGMWGRSYNGFAAWVTLKHAPPHLRSLFVAASSLPGYDFPWMRNNIGTLAPYRWLASCTGRTSPWSIYENGDLWFAGLDSVCGARLAFAKIDSVMSMRPAHWRTWLEHPESDAYYDALSLTSSEYARIDIPILSVAGHYPADGNAPGAQEYYRRHMLYGKRNATARHYLVKGPRPRYITLTMIAATSIPRQPPCSRPSFYLEKCPEMTAPTPSAHRCQTLA